MEYRLGTSMRIKQIHDTVELTCPNCGEKVHFGVFTNVERRIAAKLPLPVDVHTIYFLICPKCASAFGVNEKAGKSFKSGSPLSIGNFDLIELKDFKVNNNNDNGNADNG